MDKTKLTSIKNREQRGFALMVTFSVLLIIISLTVVLLSYFKQVQYDAADTTAMIQADVYYTDIIKTFDRFKKKKSLFSTLYKYPVSLRTADGRFTMYLRCKPMSSGVNINWLGAEKNKGMREAYTFAQTVFDLLADSYDIEERERLEEMLIAAIGGKSKFVKKEYSRLRQKNGIISYKQFTQIVSEYQLEVDDRKVGRIPWGKYFTFSAKAKRIDAEYASPELLSLLFDIDLRTVKEWFSDPYKSSLQNFVNENGADYALRKKIIVGKKFLQESECTVSFKSAGIEQNFRFNYIEGEAKHFEFYEK